MGNARTFAVLATLMGCHGPPADMNLPCVLVRAGPDGGALPILKSDPAIAYSANLDIVSFGVRECESHICVRDKSFVDPASTSPFAAGYCSGSCGRCPSHDPALDQNPQSRLNCRPLLLDSDTLMALKQADPARYQALFGGASSPDFCARGGAP